MVVHAEIVQLRVREEMVLQQACREGRVRLPGCDADERDQGALDMLQRVLVGLIDGFGRRDCEVVLRRWVLDLLSNACEGVEGDAVEDRGRHDGVFSD